MKEVVGEQCSPRQRWAAVVALLSLNPTPPHAASSPRRAAPSTTPMPPTAAGGGWCEGGGGRGGLARRSAGGGRRWRLCMPETLPLPTLRACVASSKSLVGDDEAAAAAGLDGGEVLEVVRDAML